MPAFDCTNDELVVRIDAVNATVCASQLKMLQLLAEADDSGTAWEDWGAQDMCHWISMRYGVSYYRAER
jgi:hypothetical protein